MKLNTIAEKIRCHLTPPLHHAYCILGNREKVASQILSALKEQIGFAARGNPDYWFAEYEVFGIDEARFIKEAAGRQAIDGGSKVFMLSAGGMTTEAQNALLKIFEEPVSHTHFFLILPAAESVLPTLLSRMVFIDCREAGTSEPEEAISFLKSSLPSRLAAVQSLLKKSDGDTAGTDYIGSFLDALEHAMERLPRTKECNEALEQLYLSKKYARDRSPSRKLLLEHLALVLPQSMKHEAWNMNHES